MPNTELEDDIGTLRRAAAALRELCDVDAEEIALATRFEATSNALELGTPVLRPDLVLRAARNVLKAQGGAP